MKTIQPGILVGKVNVPASKSYMQRVLLAAALADGESIIKNPGKSDDDEAMLDFIQLLGAKVTDNETSYSVIGAEHCPDQMHVNMRESGLGIRLVTCILAALGGKHEITGKGSLHNRPMSEFENLFNHKGIQIQTASGVVPIQIEGKIEAGEYFLDGSLSSQFVSGMLMALPILEGQSTLHVKELKSVPYVKMTLEILEEFGVLVSNHDYLTFEIEGNQNYQATEIVVEGDWSSAATWFVASALGHDIQINGLNERSSQADKRILTALENAGCDIWLKDGIYTCSEAKNAFSFDATDSPDLIPILVSLAAFMEGKTTIVGAERLIHKESNRATALQEEFGKLGLKIELEGDLMHIYGTGKLKGGKVTSHNDHRIAMALAIAAMSAEDEVEIAQSESVKKSYPYFWMDLEQLNENSTND